MPVFVYAAEIEVDLHKTKVFAGEEFVASVRLHAEEPVNAVEGTVLVPTDIFTIRDIRDGNSTISLWIEHPQEVTPGVVTFSGITPGGLHGSNNLLFSLSLVARHEGAGTVLPTHVRVLANDGKGTNIPLTVTAAAVVVKPGDDTVRTEQINDTEPPEDFTPKIGRDPTIFDGAFFVTFAAQDKVSGVDHYEVREGDWGWFVRAESPYVLKHQALDRTVYIKAVDNKGNERIVLVPASTATACVVLEPGCVFVHTPEWVREWANVILGVLVLLVLAYRIWRKRTR